MVGQAVLSVKLVAVVVIGHSGRMVVIVGIAVVKVIVLRTATTVIYILGAGMLSWIAAAEEPWSWQDCVIVPVVI